MLQLLTDPMFLIFAPATLIPLTAIISHFAYKAYRDGQEVALKREMIQRGMSADDIVIVLQASGGRGDDRRRRKHAGDERVRAEMDLARR